MNVAKAVDTLTVTRDLEAAGVGRRQARAIAGAMHQVAGATDDTLATKADLAAVKADLAALAAAKCPLRHGPLDPLSGTQHPTPSGRKA